MVGEIGPGSLCTVLADFSLGTLYRGQNQPRYSVPRLTLYTLLNQSEALEFLGFSLVKPNVPRLKSASVQVTRGQSLTSRVTGVMPWGTLSNHVTDFPLLIQLIYL